MNEMIEKMAGAMAKRREELIAQPLARIYPELAIAALRVLREPTGEMVAGMRKWGLEENFGEVEANFEEAFKAAIDSILPKESESK
ncbi:hypothetical protein [Microvirga alba]|uniref:Uncharacterized protein n=1 Tax=Microvirga alba TaxID=2791025 RepID=A0A931FTH6_9HYPH|nr:hypothetical protein [Microvirga alba]MBF9234696.1 hypothetical protein [Microvirga alba]